MLGLGMTPPRSPDDHSSALSSRLQALSDGIACPAADLPSGAKGDRVIELAQIIDLLRLEQARVIAAFDADGLWASDGARSVPGWITSRVAMTSGRASHLSGKSRELRAAPMVEDAWAAGRLCEETAFALLAARKVHPVLFDDQAESLLGWIDGLRVDHALTAIRYWISLAKDTLAAEKAEGVDGSGDPDDAATPDAAAENTATGSQSFGGRWFFGLDYDPVKGHQVNERAKAWIDRQFAQGTYRADDGMNYQQRMAAAFDALTEAGAIAGQTLHGDPRPSVTLHLDAKTLNGEPAEDFDDAMTRKCHLDDGTPVPRATAERFLCNARLTIVASTVGEFGQVETIGITDLLRDATSQQRTALRLRDKGCVFPGCNAPWNWCEAHHLLPWEDGGVTLLENMVLLCKHHHHLVHEGLWTLWRASDGNLYLTKPDGTPVAMTPHGQLVDRNAPAPQAPSPAPRRKGELRFLTPRERTARIAERERRQRQSAADQAANAAQPRPKPTPPPKTAPPAGTGPGHHTRPDDEPAPDQHTPGSQPPQHGPPAAA